MTVSKISTSLALGLALGILPVITHAGATDKSLATGIAKTGAGPDSSERLGTPYKPTASLMEMLEKAPAWTELYEVPAKEVPKAMTRAKQGYAPANTLIAAIAERKLHFSIGSITQAFPETKSTLTRAGKKLEYYTCGTAPTAGDWLQVTYAKPPSPWRAELDAKLVDYLAYGNDKPEPLDIHNPEECGGETHSRMFLAGTLKLYKDGKLKHTQEVLLQNIVHPDH